MYYNSFALAKVRYFREIAEIAQLLRNDFFSPSLSSSYDNFYVVELYIYFGFESAIKSFVSCTNVVWGFDTIPSYFGIKRRQCKKCQTWLRYTGFEKMFLFFSATPVHEKPPSKVALLCSYWEIIFFPFFGICIVLFFNKIPRNQWHLNLQICIHFLFFILFFQIWMYVCTLYNFHENY